MRLFDSSCKKRGGVSVLSPKSYLTSLPCFVIPLFFSFIPPPPRQILPYLPSFLLFLSPLWSICDPDIHHRRLTSCVWASSVPHLLLFIPCCVLAVWTVYKHTIAATCTLCVLVHKANVCLWLCMCVFLSTRPPSWRQVIHNSVRQRKFVAVSRTQTGRRTKAADMAAGWKCK